MWQRDQIGFRLREELCAGDIVTLEVLTPAGTIVMMGEPEDVGRMVIVRGVHIHSEPLHEVGTANLAVIAQALMQRYDYDEIVIKGARRGARSVRGSSRVKSGTAVALNLRPDRDRLGPVASIPAIEALVKRHLPLLRAKRAIEAMLDDGAVFVEVPRVENVRTLAGELRAAGVVARPSIVQPTGGRRDETVDVAALRQRLGMTQEQFARVFQIALPVVRNWEQGGTSRTGSLPSCCA